MAWGKSGGSVYTQSTDGPMTPALRADEIVPGPRDMPPTPDPLPRIEAPWSLPQHILTEPDTGRKGWKPGERESVGGSRQIDMSRQLRRSIWEAQQPDPVD